MSQMSKPTSTEDRQKALAVALAQIEKQFGKGTIMRLGADDHDQVQVISTRSLALDKALGVGGLPRGRVVEIYGPESSGKTTLTLSVIAEAQSKGLVCAFIDAEHALDVQYASSLGVNVSDLLINQPDNAEQALEVIDALVRSGAVDVVILDSVAALVPKAELDGEMGDSLPGLNARLMSQALRKLTASIKQTNTLVIFINQIRMKIGVMFGCFQYNSRVVLADGSTKKIGTIVNQKLPVEVLSYNAQTNAIEPRKVVNWFDNGVAEQFLNIRVAGGNSGRRHMHVTPNHTIFTPDGEVAAGDLKVGDLVLARATDYSFTGQALQVLMGSSLGDASVRLSKSKTRASVRFGHGSNQTAYAAWKYSFLSTACGDFHLNSKNQPRFDVKTSSFGATLNSWVRIDNVPSRKKQVSRQATQPMVDQLNPLAFAVWYLDDGTFGGSYEKWGKGRCSIAAKATDAQSLQRLADRITLLGGGTPTVVAGRGLSFDAESTWKFQSLIAPYVPESMQYKLHPKLRNVSSTAAPNPTQDIQRTSVVVADPVLAISLSKKTKSMQKFDLEIEGNHSYLVDGIIVHNSPETTTGGNALKFYASVRLDIRRTGAIKKGEEVIGNETKVKVVKNKVAPPFKEAHFEILYGKGINSTAEAVDLGVELKLLDKSGSWYAYNGSKIAQGKDKACEYFNDNPELRNELIEKVRAADSAPKAA